MSPRFSLRTNQKYLLRKLTEALESGKINDQKISQDNWVAIVELLACITGLKAQQGKPLTVPKLKPRGRSAGVNFDKLLKAEERRRKLVQAADAEGFQLVPYKADTTEAAADQAEGKQK